MIKLPPILLYGFVIIALVDSLGSIASRKLLFNYSNLCFISLIIYTTIPFLIARHGDRKSAVIAGALLGLFDVTVGLRISTALKANTGDFDMNTMTPIVFILTAIMMTLIGCFFGLLGYWLSTKISTNK